MDQLQLYVVRFNCTSVTFSWDLQHLQHPPLSSAINQPSSMNQHYPPPCLVIQLGGGQRLFNWSTFNNRGGKPEGRINPDILTFYYLLFLYKYILVLFFIVRKMLLTLRYNISNLNCLQDIYIKNNFKLFQNIQKPEKHNNKNVRYLVTILSTVHCPLSILSIG